MESVSITRLSPSGNYRVDLGGIKYSRSNADDVLRELSHLEGVKLEFKDEFDERK